MGKSDKNVLIAYGSHYGSTEEISHEIAKVLKNEGLTTRLVDLKKNEERGCPLVKIIRWSCRRFWHQNDAVGGKDKRLPQKACERI